MNKLIRAKIQFETEIVVENVYGDSPEKAALSAFQANRSEIISQAMEENGLVVVDARPVKNIKDLPYRWSSVCLPWLPSIAYGSKEQEKNIRKFFPK